MYDLYSATYFYLRIECIFFIIIIIIIIKQD